MKKLEKNIILLVAGLFILNSFSSCKKLLEVDPAGSSLLTTSVFTDSVTVQSAIAGMYATFAPQGSPYRTTLSYLPSFSADEFQYVGSNFDPYVNNAILSTDGSVRSIWSTSYSAIYNANALIEYLASSKNISVRFQNQAVAEARFMRAFCYFYLVNTFGDVPLILTTDVSKNSVMSRTPAADVYTQIVADLKFAQSTLPGDYSPSAGTRTRANKWVATAMLARVDLYLSDWAGAEAEATAVISNQGLFSLSADLNKVFTPNNSEAIWQLYNDLSGFTTYANTVLPNAVTKIPTYVLTPSLVTAFEPGDARKTSWTNTLVYNGATYTYPYKYKSIVSGANAEYFTMLRLAEQYLIRAEARAKQANISGAVEDINKIRARARVTTVDLPDYLATISVGDCLTAIAKERRIELYGELGHRWLDLKRTGTVNAVIGAYKPSFWKPTAALYPIPSAEILLNNNLSPNPGYN
jgi:hypothetical protein